MKVPGHILSCIALAIIWPALACGNGLPGFPRLATIKVGEAPHQIIFDRRGERAYVAVAGSDKVTEIDARSYEMLRDFSIDHVPLGLVLSPDEGSLLVTQFGSDAIARLDLTSGSLLDRMALGGAPTLFTGPLADDRWLVVSERSNRLSIIDVAAFTTVSQHATGGRPFPASVTSDGRRAFVPNYGDGTVSVIDIENGTSLATVAVGPRPTGGTVLPGGGHYAVAVRGTSEIALINTQSLAVDRRISKGIGEAPFSVLAHPDGKRAFVNATTGHEISIIDLETFAVTHRFSVPRIPICIAIPPNGRTLWVASEGDHLVAVFGIP